MTDQPTYWFPAKRYGWGWGLPATTAGWVALALFLAAEAVVAYRTLPGAPADFALESLLPAAAFFVVCLLKGEPPAWHWGD